ncbi:IS66 family insertion sequence element accessory protein TnpB [uncultured Clostridium sp.]|uniref:IS66 family insertion sequence element accessory protein TnpB n=1 Tax=uncultured Clostridium sp. TaxID=59620 RepID=UPI00345D7926
MFNIDKIDTVYIDCGVTDLRKSIDGLIMIVKNELKLDPFERALFIFFNKQRKCKQIKKSKRYIY